MQSETNLVNAHFRLSLTLNEASYTWSDPYVRKELDFLVPVALLDSKKLATLIEEIVGELKAEYPKAVAQYEKQLAEEKAQKEHAELGDFIENQ